MTPTIHEPPPFHRDAPHPAGLRVLQVIVLALFLGVAIFALIAAFVPLGGPAPGGAGAPGGPGGAVSVPGMFRIVCVALVVTLIPAAFIVRKGILSGAGVIDDDGEPVEEALLLHFCVSTIIGCALLEGASMFAVVIYLLTRDPIDLALAAAPAATMLLAFFPTADRWDRAVRSARDRS